MTMLVGETIVEAGDKRLSAVLLFDAAGNPVTSLAGTPPASAVLSSPAGLAVSAVILPLNLNRRGVVIYNDSGKNLRVAFAPTASATAFTYLIPSKQTLELQLGGYTGDIAGIWEGAGGFARITEIVA
jgi:hypothetical protein